MKLARQIEEHIAMMDSIFFLIEENIHDDEFFDIFIDVAVCYSSEIKTLKDCL